MSEKMELNIILEKHLKKYEMSCDALPNNLALWRKFLERINNYYNDLEQERYILERSSEIAAYETRELNKKMEDAQHLVGFWRWNYNKRNNKILFSKEFYATFGKELIYRLKKKEDILKYIHNYDKQAFIDTIENSITKGIDSECEIRFINKKMQFMWLYIICHPIKNIDGNIEELSGIGMDITKRKEVEEKITLLNQQVISAARHSGMAEVATSMLHNLGNILNSANVSLHVLIELINKATFNKLVKTIDLVEAHMPSIHEYLTNDEKGKLVPPFLVAISSVLKNDYETAKCEIANLNLHLNHIKEIVSLQQNIAVATVKIETIEKIYLPEVIDTALQMCTAQINNNKIHIKKNYYNFTNFIYTDKTKLIQILINLIQNAKQAIEISNKQERKEIIITAKYREKDNNNDKDNIDIIIQDNGIGITSEQMKKIFSYGYTSKKDGHGFGLHSSALFAQKMGGDLQASSQGAGKGATFILSLPLNDKHSNKERI